MLSKVSQWSHAYTSIPRASSFWVLDYRIFDPNTDGKSKLDHVREMLVSVKHRQLPFARVLMDQADSLTLRRMLSQ